MNKFIKVLLMTCVIFTLAGSGCISTPAHEDNSPDTQKTAPTVKLDNSLERELINCWLKEVGDPNNIMWLYHMSETGQILGEYPIVGKAVSMTKSNEPYERVLDDFDGAVWDEEEAAKRFEGYRLGTTQLANPSGTYGHDLEGVFFFTPDGEYHEIHGGIIHVSSVPIKINDPMFLTYDIDKEKQEKEKMWEAQLKNGSKV